MRIEPFYRRLVPGVVFPLAERLGGRRMWTELRDLRGLQWLPRDELEARALDRLRALLAHATMHVPYYRDLFAQAGLQPTDIKDWSDLSRIPTTTKSDLRRNFPARTTASNLPPRRRQRMRTAGSTGMPLEFFWDRARADQLLGGYLFSLEWAGVSIWDTRITITIQAHLANTGASSSTLRRIARRVLLGEVSVYLSSGDSITVEFCEVVRRACRRGGYFIRGVPSSIARLALELGRDGMALEGYPKAVFAFAETLTDINAEAIRRLFLCPVVNYYTSWEVPQMAQTCPDNVDVLHVNADRVILRVLRPDGSEAAPGEPGTVVVSDLSNYVMPFINYFIGDRAVIGPPCRCGRGLPTLTRLEGRSTEAIRTPSGREINPGLLGHFLIAVAGAMPYVWEYQAVQMSDAAVVLRVVPTAHFTTEFAATLRREFENFLGRGAQVGIEVVDRIPVEPSGKRLIIKRIAS
jgi:phenylacetate-CoA ligase